MKQRIAALTTMAILFGTSTLAGPVEDAIVADLTARGFTYIEVETGATRVKAEAVRGTEKIEVVYDAATGVIIRQETGLAGDDAGRVGVKFKSDDSGFSDDDDLDDDESDDDDDSDEDDDSDDDHGDDDDGHDDDDRGDDDDHGGDRDDDSGDDDGDDD